MQIYINSISANSEDIKALKIILEKKEIELITIKISKDIIAIETT